MRESAQQAFERAGFNIDTDKREWIIWQRVHLIHASDGLCDMREDKMKLPLPDKYDRDLARFVLLAIIIVACFITLMAYYLAIVIGIVVFATFAILFWKAFAPLKKGD